MEAFKKVSTGNLADAVEEATGNPGFMNYDMKPIFKTKIVGPASTAVLRRVLKTDARTYPNQALQILDEAPSGNILVYVLEDGLNIAGMGNLMATTAKVRGLAGAVIDGGVRDVEETDADWVSGLQPQHHSGDFGRPSGQRVEERAGDLRGCSGATWRLHHGRLGWDCGHTRGSCRESR